MELPTKLRAMKESDENYVRKTWLKNYLNEGRGLHKDKRHKKVESLWETCRRHITLAVLPQDEDIIVGWLCADAPVLYYIYVRERYRKSGIATKLFLSQNLQKEGIVKCPLWTRAAKEIQTNYPQFRRVP